MSFNYTVKKGDTLNKIANAHGFRNYKDAGIRSDSLQSYKNKVPLRKDQHYADVIGVGEEITLENYDPNNIQIETQLAEKQAELKDKQSQLAEVQKQPTTQTKTEASTSGNIAYNNFIASKAEIQENQEVWAEEQQAKYDKRYDSDLAFHNAQYASDVQEAKDMFALRIKEQVRMDTLSTDRRKAYGKAQGGIYKPLMFYDAVKESEQEAQDNLSRLEGQRKILLDNIKMAFEKGKAGLSADLEDQYEKIVIDMQDNIRKQIDESRKTYELQTKLRKEEEAKDVKEREEDIKRLQAFVSLNREEYENLTPEEINEKAEEAMLKFGMEKWEAESAIMAGKEVDYKQEKTKAEIAKIEEQTRTEAQKGITEKSKQYKNYKDADKEDDGGEVPFTNAEKKSLEQAGLGDAGRQQKLDFLAWGKDKDDSRYANKYPPESSDVSGKQGDFRSKYNY